MQLKSRNCLGLLASFLYKKPSSRPNTKSFLIFGDSLGIKRS